MGIEKEQYPDYIEKIIDLHVSKGQESIRLDVYITNAIANATRNKVQQAIDDNQVTVNGISRKGSYKIKPGDNIQCVFMRPPPLELLPEDIPLEIIFEDEYLLVINKPAGLVVHPGFGNRYGTLVNAVLWHVGYREAIPLSGYDQESLDEEEMPSDEFIHAVIEKDSSLRPGIVHRLDKDTSGLMVIAKKPEITPELSRQFADRTVKREYIALAWGVMKLDHDIIENHLAPSPRNRKVFAIAKQDGKYAKTEYWTRARGSFASLLQIKLHTGRTHQIRVHFSSINHPLIGDMSYGGDILPRSPQQLGNEDKKSAILCLQSMPHQALHARMLGFTHPITGEDLLFTQCPPKNFKSTASLAGIVIPKDLCE
jgi:23S rRNA pseudouridine1911/1915/1917 synthase